MRMFKATLSLLLILSSFFGICQNPQLDSLLSLSATQQGAQKVATLNQLSQQLLSTNVVQAGQYAQQALDESIRISDWIGMAKAYDNLGLSFLAKFDTERAMTAFVEGLKVRDEQQSEQGQASSRIYIGQVFFQMEEYNQAEESYQRALEISAKTEAVKEAALAYEGLGEVYLAKRIFGKSLEQFDQALQFWMSVPDFEKAANIATKLGDISASLGDYEGALNYYRTSLNLARELNDIKQVARLKTNMASALMGQNMPREALVYSGEAYDTRVVLNDSVGMAENLKGIGLAQQSIGEVGLAKQHFKQSVQLLNQVQISPTVPKIFQEIAEAYAELGDTENAYHTQLAFSKARNDNYNQEKAKALLDLTTKYQSAFEAREQQAQIEMLEIENSTGRKISYFLFAMLGLIGLLLTNLFLSYRRKQKANELLGAKNEEILSHKNEISGQNQELEAKNVSLDLLNKKLVDEIAERENIEKSSFARDRFLATMSHEMRTPLNVITGLTHILLESEPRMDQVEHLRTLQFSANDLVVFINDVLDFSKIEAGKLNLEDRPFQPSQVFKEVKSQFAERADDSGILFNFFQDPKLPVNLLGDDARLMQIMTNLLSNTFQHTQEGYVKVDIALRELKPHEAMLEVIVEGSDGGVKRKILEEVFKQWDDEEDEFMGYEGQHFSLTITKRLVELQNGKMEVNIEPGESTAFVLLLPYKLVAGNKTIAPTLSKRDYSALEGQRIMVVEDNKINQLVVAKMLRKTGAIVETADDGLDALEIFDQKDFDLILMDIQMPKMDGYRATAEIRRHPNPDKQGVPIIALTASAFLTEKEKAVLFGMNDHVGKPFGPDELMEKIIRCLKIYRNA